jgi:dihydrofolate synthase / folylpolyglutamate synthase
LDGGHNKSGAKTISDWIKNKNKTKNYLICAMLKDKDSQGFLKQLAKQTELLIGLEITGENSSKKAAEIANIAQSLNIKSQPALSFTNAIEEIKKYHSKNYHNHSARIIICGSLYLAGKFLQENES